MNNQPIEKSIIREGLLEIVGIFQTIQGEGPFAGSPAIFVRLAGCNLQCPHCDTDYTSGRYQAMPEHIFEECRRLTSPSRLVVITGGEPFRQNIVPLCRLLIAKGYRVQIETNGTLSISNSKEFGDLDSLVKYGRLTIVCSPKAGKVSSALEPFITAYKYVLHADSVSHIDGLPIRVLGHGANPQVARPHLGFVGTVYLQPADMKSNSENQRHLDACIRSCLKYGYTLGLQLHKQLNME